MGTVEIRQGDIVHISDNRATARFFGTTPQAMRGRSARELGVPPAYIDLWLRAYRASLTSDGPVRFDYYHEGKGWLEVSVNYIGRGAAGQRFLYVVDDISDRKRAEGALRAAHDQLERRVKERTAALEAAHVALEVAYERLQHDALYDALTGLPNRRLFTDRLNHALERYHRDPELGFAVLFIDLDHFKVINDSLGHPAGDALLVAVSQRLAACVRESDTVARLGGDEFTMLLEHCDAARAAEVVGRLRGALARSFEVWGRNFTLSGSVGLVFAEADHSSPQDLLRDADLAMYRAKVHRSGQHEVFDASMREEAVSRLELEADLRVALAQGTLDTYFQPVVRLDDLRLVGFEALVRWPHPKRGLLTPDHFIPLAEETKLVLELDRQVLQRACRALCEWQRDFPELTPLSVNVNLSSWQFLREALVGEVEWALRQHGLQPEQLNLEITEGVLMHPAALVDATVAQLSGLGVGLCLDDFGTGYASLAYLQRFPAGGLKVDRVFIQGIGEGEKSAVVVEGVATMAQKLGMRVVAEGVETEAQRERALSLGCRYGQGYLFAPPLSAEQTRAFLTDHARRARVSGA